jgi:NAD(P)-dependent dehydrogenase (short-subunit alcohol dehydrogenase family)
MGGQGKTIDEALLKARRDVGGQPARRGSPENDAEPEEAVWAALFLASDEAPLMAGTVVPVDGGVAAV